MMMMTFGCFFIFSLPFTVLSTDSLIFRVDITTLQTGQQSSDLIFIDETLKALSPIKVIQKWKTFDNQGVILVLEVQEINHLSSLTLALSGQRYQLSVTRLQPCKEYASELGVDADFASDQEIRQHDVIQHYDVVYYDKGMKYDDYRDRIKFHFETVTKLGCTVVCYQSYGDLPVELMYFCVTLSPPKVEQAMEKLREMGKASVKMSLLQSFQSYIES